MSYQEAWLLHAVLEIVGGATWGWGVKCHSLREAPPVQGGLACAVTTAGGRPGLSRTYTVAPSQWSPPSHHNPLPAPGVRRCPLHLVQVSCPHHLQAPSSEGMLLAAREGSAPDQATLLPRAYSCVLTLPRRLSHLSEKEGSVQGWGRRRLREPMGK